MSLKEAMMEIADNIDSDLKEHKENFEPFFYSMFQSYARQIRTACRAAPDVDNQRPDFMKQVASLPSHRDMIDLERAKLRAESQKVNFQESEARLVECVGGGMDSIMTSVPSDMPVGAKTEVQREVYVLDQDGTLKYSQEETLKNHKPRITT
jgi:hypothetical protein